MWLERLETTCLQTGCDIHMEALGRAGGGILDCLIGMPNNQPWEASREELKRCFSDLTSLGHTATQLENTTQ